MSSAATPLHRLQGALEGVVLGQKEAVADVLTAFLAHGHVLLEGVPGVAKTLLARALASALGLTFTRVQFTPDLMPSDISGHAVWNPKSETFNIRRGPVFTNLLLADEINRAPAKTQSALLEAMQEQQVTIEGQSFPLAPPFLVAGRRRVAVCAPHRWMAPASSRRARHRAPPPRCAAAGRRTGSDLADRQRRRAAAHGRT